MEENKSPSHQGTLSDQPQSPSLLQPRPAPHSNSTAPESLTKLTEHLATKGAPSTSLKFEDAVKRWFMGQSKKLKSLCGTEEDSRRMLIAALNAVSKTPSLMECTFESFTSCLLTCAELRLMPGALQECAIVPFNNSKKGCKEAVFMLQYQGLCQLLYRSGFIKDIECEIVCEKDFFEFKRGSDRKLVFEPFDGDWEERGEWVGVYCIIRNTFGGEHIKYMTTKEVNAIKARSRAANSSDSPWNSKYLGDKAWMWMKTVLKQNAKMMPKNVKLSIALNEYENDVEVEEK